MKHTIKFITALLVIFLLQSGCQPINYETTYKPLVDQYVGYWNTGNLDGIENVLHPDYQLMSMPDFKPLAGIEGFRDEMKHMREIGFWVQLEETNYAKDYAFARWTCGANYPDSTGAPTVNVKVQGLSMMHFKDGKILDEWIAYDIKFWMEQLGYKMVK